MNLSKDELEIVECFVQGWDESGHKLFGGISYQAVMDLLNKLGLEVPSRLQYFLDLVDSDHFKEVFGYDVEDERDGMEN